MFVLGCLASGFGSLALLKICELPNILGKVVMNHFINHIEIILNVCGYTQTLKMPCIYSGIFPGIIFSPR